MSLRFYAHAGPDLPRAGATLPTGLSVSVWRPRTDGLPPRDLAAWPNAVWWAFDRFGVFARLDCGVLMIHDGPRLAHSALVTPRYFRFPQMAADDLQIGAVFTDPDYRGRGLAKASVRLIAERWAGRYRRLWYIVEDDNLASIRVIEACGFALLGDGERFSPLGVGLLGRYQLLRPA